MSKKIPLYSNTSKPSLTYSATAETVASNVDLLTEMLIRLPAKSLIKFKSVSKQWLSIISDSQFSRSHTTHQNHPPLPSGLYIYLKANCTSLSLNDRITRVSVNGHPPTSLPNLSFLDGLRIRTNLLHSSNGLMLCSTGENCKDYVVCNLTTQRFMVLPTLAVVSKPYDKMKYSYLVFDPKKSPYYKVAVVIFAFDLNTTQLAVYSSESGSWKTVTLGPNIIPDLGIIYEALWDGAIILMACVGGHHNCAADDHVYLRFDIDAEKLTTTRVSPPTASNLSEEIMYFGECGDRLLLVQISQYNAAEFKVLEMLEGETNFRWAVKYIVDLTPFILQEIKMCISVMKVGANENDLAVVLYIQDKVVQYSIESKTWKVLCDFTGCKFPIDISSPFNKYSYHFIESLTPV